MTAGRARSGPPAADPPAAFVRGYSPAEHRPIGPGPADLGAEGLGRGDRGVQGVRDGRRARAHREGGFRGLVGKDVSEEEQQALNELAAL